MHVSQTLAPIVAEVAARLGPGFDLTVGPPVEGDIAVLAAMGREAIAFLHAQHPATVLLVVKRGATGHEDEAVDYLHAGADQFLEPGSLDEIALSIRVLARRLQPSPSRRNSTQR
ncbi:MAG: hypothetical protein QOD38_2622 [Acidimicrobiaceae bacterium]